MDGGGAQGDGGHATGRGVPSAAARRVDHGWHCDRLEEELARFVAAYERTAGSTAVPSCPEWSVDDLAAHLGKVHRWAEHLVRVAAPARVSPRALGLGTATPSPGWIRQGGEALLRTLRSADPATEMWAWGRDQHVRFWSRRQLHETMVHRIDVELAGVGSPQIDPEVAVDGIDELLANLAATVGAPAPGVTGGSGGRIRLQAGDRAGWTVTLTDTGLHVDEHGGTAEAELVADPGQLLMVAYRRAPREGAGVTSKGDTGLIDRWLDRSAL